MQSIKGLGKHEQKKFDGYFDQLKGCEPHALAQELSLMLTFSLFTSGVKEKVIEQCRANSTIIRKNRDNALMLKNKKRYLELVSGKKKLTRAEETELTRLRQWFVKKLNIKEPA